MKLPNIYFLVIGFLQMVPAITTSKGVPVNFGPLSVILAVTAIKDLFEDLKRHNSDTAENCKMVSVLKGKEWRKTKWQNLRVGEIIKVFKDEYFPADMLILKTSEPKDVCFIETKNLDGESNLKNKKAAEDMKNYIFGDENVLNLIK